jgi:asparagine synthase (glutamine-hydrolysing)
MRNYWKFEAIRELKRITDEEAIVRYRELLTDAVRLRLRSDVPVGCMLSGGLDSTAITCLAYKVLNKPIVAFSGITGELKGVYDESDYIDAVVRETNAKFHYIKPDPVDLFSTIDEMLGFHDEPVCTVTWYSLYLIAKKVRLENVPVLLNGHGGDELLGGYWDHYHYNFYDLLQNADLKTLEFEIKAWEDNHHRDGAEIEHYRDYIGNLALGKASEIDRFPDYSGCLNEDFSNSYRNKVGWLNHFPSFLSRRLYSETMFETIPASLRPEDRNTMSQSIESRSPFLDYRLIEYCFSLPNRFKIRNGLGKWLTREALRGILPENVRTRKDKAGFIAPADEWFRSTNRAQLAELLNSESLKSRLIFNEGRINKIFQEHLERKANHHMFLWQMINLELWFRRFFDA